MRDMRILITIPSFARHGGIRVILEWATRLSKTHRVQLYCEQNPSEMDWYWFGDIPEIVFSKKVDINNYDCIIITSPHSVHLLDQLKTENRKLKTFLFCQMLEHLFRPGDRAWFEQCRRFYTAPFPMFYISRWNHAVLTAGFEREGSNDIYIGNGVNLEHFPISRKPKDGVTILVEGWECSNPTKDIHYVAPRVAAKLKAEGYYIIAYGALPITQMREACDEYYYQPNTAQLNELYERATIMLKAGVYDARSCAPMEAMTKGTVTVRAAWLADDDLRHNENCVRCDYDANAMYLAAKRMLLYANVREAFAEAGRTYVTHHCKWDSIIQFVNQKITE